MDPFGLSMQAMRTQLLGVRPPLERGPETETFTAAALSHLAAEHYTLNAWWRFWKRSWTRSIEAAGARPRAAIETHLLHAVLLAVTADPRVAISWAMTWTHLGLIPEARGLGLPNAISVVRANLPLLAPRKPRLAAVAALTSDFADGIIARRKRGETAFGAYADGLADALFWTWYASRFEPYRRLRQLAIVFWLSPPFVITAVAFMDGRLPAVPRPRVVHVVSALLQLVLTARVFGRAR